MENKQKKKPGSIQRNALIQIIPQFQHHLCSGVEPIFFSSEQKPSFAFPSDHPLVKGRFCFQYEFKLLIIGHSLFV